jgi:tetratricopeptide (TPR) repeat protein
LAGALDTPSSDIYSLGVVMYELVTGSLRARAFAPASFEALPTKTPMAAVIYRCLQSQPARRPTNASEILLALDHEPGTEPPGVRPRRRRTISWVLAAAGASVALILALFRSGNGHSPGVEGIVTATAASPAPVERPSVDRIVALSRAISAAPASAQLKRHARAPFRRTKAAPSPDATRENSRNFLESAEARLRAGRIEEACVEGRAAATQSPALPESWEFLGRCYMRLGEPAEARTYYRRYLDLSPDGNNAVFIRAMLGESDL